ncbi:Hypothetical predicted protein [Marmota monax]|uniref:Uncharacterized protein n=1 Tax=Marmota monax TaxID=9995 RepID=A0A5E4AZ59_MARMO|nr:hypothetical protein GHT09_010823 [Marmota monax]VTJ61692.1 Hypothetical predicted protein [Marmota monax]
MCDCWRFLLCGATGGSSCPSPGPPNEAPREETDDQVAVSDAIGLVQEQPEEMATSPGPTANPTQRLILNRPVPGMAGMMVSRPWAVLPGWPQLLPRPTSGPPLLKDMSSFAFPLAT